MKHLRILSLLLCLAMLVSLFLSANVASAEQSSSNKGMEISKTAQKNEDGTYTITLEAYATGSKVISEVTEEIPTDIVLVLDQSGSMANSMPTTKFQAYTDKTNSNYYNNRHNGGDANLWHKLSDGSYTSVSVNITDVKENYNPITTVTSNSQLAGYALYYKNSDGEFRSVTVNPSTGWTGTSYTYKDSETGDTIATGYDTNVFWENTTLPTEQFYSLSLDYSSAAYKYSYVVNEEVIEITTSVGDTTVCDTTFYRKTTDNSSTRLDALTYAVKNFADSVAKKAAGKDGDILTTYDNVNHRIAIAGFSSSDYNNTELLTGSTITKGDWHGTSPNTSGSYYYYPTGYEMNGPDYYSRISNSQYKNSLQSMNLVDGQENVKAGISAVTAHGGTKIDAGIEMANKIFENNPLNTNEKRNRVIIVFTDGAPGSYGDWGSDSRSTANNAISKAYTSKNTYNATVYTVGIFEGADATNPSSLPTYSSGNNLSEAAKTNNSNRFMHLLSSNYPNATNMTNTGNVNGQLNGKSYYLSASDADTLNNIFQQISDQIESGGSTATLSSETVIKDIISPSFVLPEGATADNITLETYQCTGKKGGVYTWRKNDTAMDAQATVNGDQVSVTGFDFKEHYVGTVTDAGGNVTYRGHKLVISFTVKPKAGFLGGNNVETNTMAGVYENDSSTDPVLTFEKPQVNVPIGDVSVTAADQNVYLLADVTGASLKAGTTVTVGGVPLNLDPTVNNFGLEAWQNAFVSIDVKLLDGNGKEITDFNDLVNDATYSVSVTVSPKTDGQNASGTAAVPKSDSDGAKIDVYKPYIVFQDSSINAGDTPNYATDNFVSVAWKHGDFSAPTDMGTAPALTYTYDPAAAPLSAESQVKVSVAMNVTDDNSQGDDVTQYVSFYRNACTAENGCDFQGGAVSATDANRVNFIVHIKTFDLTITKRGTNSIDHDDSTERQSYIFHVSGPNGFKMDIVICGDGSKTIKNLPVGEYTITEEENWSWRYTAQPYTVTADSIKGGSATVTVENTRDNDKWLNGGAYVSNLFGKLKSGN